MGVAHFFKVLEDAAFELIDMRQARIAHVNGGFLAANAAGAKADHRFVLELCLVRLHGIGELGEFGDAPVDGVLECARVHFKLIACVQRDHRTAFVIMPLV